MKVNCLPLWAEHKILWLQGWCLQICSLTWYLTDRCPFKNEAFFCARVFRLSALALKVLLQCKWSAVAWTPPVLTGGMQASWSCDSTGLCCHLVHVCQLYNTPLEKEVVELKLCHYLPSKRRVRVFGGVCSSIHQSNSQEVHLRESWR